MEEGRCFRCDKIGHRANDPKFHPRPNNGQSSQPSRFSSSFQRPSNPPQRPQQIRQTQITDSAKESPKARGEIRELIRTIEAMNEADQDVVLGMFKEEEEVESNNVPGF